MVSVAMLIGGALANALAFTGSSYKFKNYKCSINYLQTTLMLKERDMTR